MAHHHNEKKENINNLYYLVGVLGGLLTASMIEISPVYLITGAIVGFLFAALFLNTLVKGRVDA